MKFVLVTQDAPVYLGTFVDQALTRLIDKGHDAAGVVAFGATFQMSAWQAAMQRLRYYGPVDFIRMSSYVVANQLLARAAAVVPRLGCFSIANACRRNGVARLDFERVNSRSFLQFLRREKVDLVISVASPQIFKKRLLATPALGCINYHMGELPRFRGRQPLFWALQKQEARVGITVHEMDEKIDNGAIVAQQAVRIAERESLHSLYLKCIAVGPDLLVDAVQQLADGSEKRIPNDPAKATYFGFPEKQDVALFRQRGNRFF